MYNSSIISASFIKWLGEIFWGGKGGVYTFFKNIPNLLNFQTHKIEDNIVSFLLCLIYLNPDTENTWTFCSHVH